MLLVALAPARVAADEFDERGGILLEARAFPRQHAHAVAGAAHQHGFDLVMTEHVAFDQRTFGENRQLAMRYEWHNAHDRVVAPVRAAVALPPGAADSVGAHAQPHTE